MCKDIKEKMKEIANDILANTELDRRDVINTINWLSFDKSIPEFVRYLESGEQEKDKTYFDQLLRKLNDLRGGYPQKIEMLSKMVTDSTVKISDII